MISQRRRGLYATLLVLQSGLAVLLLAICAALTFTIFTAANAAQIKNYPLYAAVLIVGLMIEAFNREQKRSRLSLIQQDFINQHRLAIRQTTFAIGTLLVYLAAMKDGAISRVFLVLYAPMLYCTLLWSNRCLPRHIGKLIFAGTRQERMLLIGSAERAARLGHWLWSKEVFGMRTLGILSESSVDEIGNANGIRHLGQAEDAERVIRTHRVTQVILLALPEDSKAHKELVRTVERCGARLLILSNLEEKLEHPVVHVEDEGYRFISLRSEPLENPLNRIAKRMLDMALALFAVVFVMPPVALVVWLCQRVQSPGPLFYRQKRAGIQNREFEIIKFRTMHVDNPDASRQATQNDARVYGAGRWLRRLSLDELPQFLNVLKGEMSVIGPRPHLTEHNERFASQMANYQIRAVVKPGITGLAQVRGYRGEARTATEIGQRLESDIAYLENWRLALDIMIIARTAAQMLFPPRSAY
jgi:exopolysaccharide biosynthesis polyprenyl glycosylphosphotransferase